MALQTATLPSLALLAARGEKLEVSRTFAFGMRLALFVAIPASVAYVTLAEPLVVLIFQRGAFDAESSLETAKALMAQGTGIWLVAGVRQLVAVYYAQGDTRTPAIISAIDLGVFVVLAVTLRDTLGHVGISLAVSGASLVQFVLLWAALRKHLPDVRVFEIGSAALKTLGAALAAGIAASLTADAVLGAGLGGSIAGLLPGTAGASVFCGVFLLGAWLLRINELSLLATPLAERFRKRPSL
jgi:putative peptidoglycan lipid II flippase